MEDLTRQEVIDYMKKQGTGVDENLEPIEKYVDWWLNCQDRREQIIECVRKNYGVLDFDEWQHIQDVLFKNKKDTILYKTSLAIANALWEEGIEVLELPYDA